MKIASDIILFLAISLSTLLIQSQASKLSDLLREGLQENDLKQLLELKRTACVESEEYNPETNVCQGIYCNENGDPISWTKPNCYAPPDKVARGNQAHSGGCFFGDQRLQPGQQVTSGCWNVMCTDSGLVLDGSGCSLDSAPANDGMPAIGRK